MPLVATMAAELAAVLARAVGDMGVVCLGCPLDRGGAAERGLISLIRPPLTEPSIELERLLLLVAPRMASPDLSACAAASVPEVWLFESEEGLISSLTNPVGGRYRRRSLILPGERVILAGLPDVELTPLPHR